MTHTHTLTKNQQIILEILEGHGVGTHLTAYDLLMEAKKRQPNIGMATVHRAVTQLHEQGHISKVVIPGMDSATYEPAAEQHAHFRCKRCGALEDVDYSIPQRTINELAARLGCQLDEEQLTLSGVCKSCLRADGEKKRIKRAV